MLWMAIIAFLLAAAVVWWGLIALGALLDHLETKVNNAGGTTVATTVEDILSEEIEKKIGDAQKVSFEKLKKKVGQKGMMTCELDENNKVKTDTIEWIGADQRDQEVQDMLDEYDGLLMLEH